MKRNVSLEEISDGKLYTANDMVKADCHGCVGCHTCCTGMGDSIYLDPYDAFNLTVNLNVPFMALLEKYVALGMADGVILPHLMMTGPDEGCNFLDSEGRCSIHSFRPGICRLFPLGRVYEKGDFKYFLQTGECVYKNPTKVKVSKWIDLKDPKENHDFIIKWHDFLESVRENIKSETDPENIKAINMKVLTSFFMTPYEEERDFYTQFNERHKSF